MQNPQDSLETAKKIPPEYIFGVTVILEGGEIDRTVRPSRFAEWQAILSRQQPSSDPEAVMPVEEGPIDGDGPKS